MIKENASGGNKMDKTDSMIRTARGCMHAYEILSKRFENATSDLQQGKPVRIEDVELSFPLVMTQTFACEVYLKILILKRGLHYNREHDLYSLYNILDADTQVKIKEKYKGLNGDNADFSEKLEKNKDVFIKWRYYYEIDLEKEPDEIYVVDTPFLDKLLESLKNVYLNLES